MFKRIVRAAVLAAFLIPLTAGGALAAPPANDTIDGAIVVESLPSTTNQDTAEATTDLLDEELNGYCHGVTVAGTVWYAYTDTKGAGLTVDATASDYSVGLMVFAGDPRAGGLFETCGPGQVSVAAHPGETFWIMAFSDVSGVTGGNLTITFTEAPPAPTSHVTIDPVADLGTGGTLRVTGTVTCTGNGEGDITGDVRQPVGRFTVTGGFYVYPLTCDGTTRTWEAEATAYDGRFAGGRASVNVRTYVCNAVECTGAEATQQVQVRHVR